MTSLKYHISTFALAAAAVTSAQADSQAACLHPLLPDLISKTAQPLASGRTIMGNISSAYAVEYDGKPGIAVLNSHANSVFFYKLDPKALRAMTDIRISPIGTLELGNLKKEQEDSPQGPDEAKALFTAEKWAAEKMAFKTCFIPAPKN